MFNETERLYFKGIYKTSENLLAKIISLLTDVPFPNVSLDLWSDATMRSFLGVIIRGINDEWEMVRLQFYLRIQYKFILEKK